MTKLKEFYGKEILPKLMKEGAYRNVMEVPRVEKIIVNIGVGEAVANPKSLDGAVADMTKIVGQKPIIRRARKSISNFKLREGMPIGCCATLRGIRMWEFLDRLISVAFPRVRDFRGISSKSFDGHGNFTVGIKEQIIFPEIDYDKIDKIRGMNITIVTSAKTDEEGLKLLSMLKMPFQNQNQN